MSILEASVASCRLLAPFLSVIKIIQIEDFHVNQLDVISAVWHSDALMHSFDKAVWCVKLFINHVTDETEIYHHAVVFMLVINSLITTHSNWIRRSLTQQARFNDGTVTLHCLTLLPPHKTGKLRVKICSKDWWETVALLEFYYLVWNQNKQGYASWRRDLWLKHAHKKIYIVYEKVYKVILCNWFKFSLSLGQFILRAGFK